MFDIVLSRFYFYHITKTLSMQYTEIFKVVKMKIFNRNFDIFLIFAQILQNIECGYTSEPPRRGSSDVYPHSMF